jgi:hypothetical protein
MTLLEEQGARAFSAPDLDPILHDEFKDIWETLKSSIRDPENVLQHEWIKWENGGLSIGNPVCRELPGAEGQ